MYCSEVKVMKAKGHNFTLIIKTKNLSSLYSSSLHKVSTATTNPQLPSVLAGLTAFSLCGNQPLLRPRRYKLQPPTTFKQSEPPKWQHQVTIVMTIMTSVGLNQWRWKRPQEP
ncbi:hypothetical protein TSUD_232440 [Trifolium subterraneum]|uniref:Uncharacterized protein n=1 Tax=Trifolium subterraneum TaxID=3900 RepID=A0A2Z6MGZ1_TRISU|nr:hypothetical protein TSUD_232440 [Trifolium subterraneum]